MKTPVLSLLLAIFSGGFLRDANCLIKQQSRFTAKLGEKKAFTTSLFAEMRILIHGTKNAWTTLRPYDLILYGLEMKVKGKERGLGVYTPDNEILPLCNHEKGSTEFFVDTLQEAYSAETLKSENRLLRIVSADRRGTECFIVEEYLDSDILIPVRDPPVLSMEVVSSPTTSVQEIKLGEDANTASKVPKLSDSFEDILAKIETAKYDQQLLQLKTQREISILETQLANLKKSMTTSDPGVLDSSDQSQEVMVAVDTPLAPRAVGVYSQAVKANGFVFVSGCVGLNAETGRLAEGGVEAETRQTLDNLKSIIEQSGSSLSKVVKVTLMIRDFSYFAEVNKIYMEYFNLNGGATVLPARSSYEVSFLPLGAFIEVDATCLI